MKKLSKPSLAIFLILTGLIMNVIYEFITGNSLHEAKEFIDVCVGIVFALFMDWYINDRE